MCILKKMAILLNVPKKTSCIPILDEYEEYNPNNLKNSLYLRKMIELPEFDCFAWIYEYNQKVMENQLI